MIWKNEGHFEGGYLDEVSRKERIKLIAHTVIFLEHLLPRRGLTLIYGCSIISNVHLEIALNLNKTYHEMILKSEINHAEIKMLNS